MLLHRQNYLDNTILISVCNLISLHKAREWDSMRKDDRWIKTASLNQLYCWLKRLLLRRVWANVREVSCHIFITNAHLAFRLVWWKTEYQYFPIISCELGRSCVSIGWLLWRVSKQYLGNDVPNSEGDEVSSRLDVYIVLSIFLPLNNLSLIPQLSSIRQELLQKFLCLGPLRTFSFI